MGVRLVRAWHMEEMWALRGQLCRDVCPTVGGDGIGPVGVMGEVQGPWHGRLGSQARESC